MPGCSLLRYTVSLFYWGDGAGRLFGLLLNPLKDSIYWRWKYLHHMFISLRHSAPSSLAPCSCLCLELSGHLMVWVVHSLHISKAPSVAVEYAFKNPPHPERLGFHNGNEPLSQCSGGCIPETGCFLFPPRPQSPIDGWSPHPCSLRDLAPLLGLLPPMAVTSPSKNKLMAVES